MVSSIAGIKILNLKKALELYDLLGEYLPENLEDDVLTVMSEMVNNISDDDFGAYADALVLMTDKSLEELDEFPTPFLLELFIDGLVKNNIVELREFCRKINYAY